ncbi:uncharacterized protein LOC114023965 [Vombatus ursinus]|uniref:uncharacterized protein LOC114023965 n=1 Tax=Vombatus ursinus TaxID=29139 RepID=UPI000FFD2321|nr:uncharacterized protein LOC114023965 [Vombatus ursinus]
MASGPLYASALGEAGEGAFGPFCLGCPLPSSGCPAPGARVCLVPISGQMDARLTQLAGLCPALTDIGNGGHCQEEYQGALSPGKMGRSVGGGVGGSPTLETDSSLGLAGERPAAWKFIIVGLTSHSHSKRFSAWAPDPWALLGIGQWTISPRRLPTATPILRRPDVWVTKSTGGQEEPWTGCLVTRKAPRLGWLSNAKCWRNACCSLVPHGGYLAPSHLWLSATGPADTPGHLRQAIPVQGSLQGSMLLAKVPRRVISHSYFPGGPQSSGEQPGVGSKEATGTGWGAGRRELPVSEAGPAWMICILPGSLATQRHEPLEIRQSYIPKMPSLCPWRPASLRGGQRPGRGALGAISRFTLASHEGLASR